MRCHNFAWEVIQCRRSRYGMAVITFVGGSGAIGSNCHSATNLVGLICRTAVPIGWRYGVSVTACARVYSGNTADVASTSATGFLVCAPIFFCHSCEFSFQALHKPLDKPLPRWRHRGVQLTKYEIEPSSIIGPLFDSWQPCLNVQLCAMV